MKVTKTHTVGFALLLTGALGSAWAEKDITQRIKVNARICMMIDADIEYAVDPVAPVVRTTPDGDAYNYDNGYVLPGPDGGVNGITWYWGYDDASQIVGDSILMSRTEYASSSDRQDMHESTAFQGLEIMYSHEIQAKDGKFYGFDIGASFQPLNFEHKGTYSPQTSVRTDTYDFTPGTTPPGAPYEGSFAGPGFVINSAPTSSSSIPGIGAPVVASSEFNANLWGIHLGPYMDVPLGKRFFIHASGGLTLALLDASLDWENAGVAAASGSDQDYEFLGGAFLGADINWYMTDVWILATGAKFEYLTSYDEELGGNEVRLDLNNTLYWTLGLAREF